MEPYKQGRGATYLEYGEAFQSICHIIRVSMSANPPFSQDHVNSAGKTSIYDQKSPHKFPYRLFQEPQNRQSPLALSHQKNCDYIWSE
jgi:hypothetical protein